MFQFSVFKMILFGLHLVLIFPTFNAFCYQMPMSGRSYFYTPLNRVAMHWHIVIASHALVN
jgi:hypothetical protein